MSDAARTFKPGIDAVQAAERSPEANPQSRGQVRALVKQREIRRGTETDDERTS